MLSLLSGLASLLHVHAAEYIHCMIIRNQEFTEIYYSYCVTALLQKHHQAVYSEIRLMLGLCMLL